MAKENPNVRVYADSNYAVWTAPLGTTPPTTLPPTAPGAGYIEAGLLTDAGISEAHNYNETKIYDLAGSLVRIARNQEERPWTFECLEENAIEAGLRYPGTTLTTTGGTAEVETVTIAGTGTAGTWTLASSNFGTVTGLAYNITTAALQTALQNAWDEAVTVTGTAGTSYIITFPVAAGNIGQLTATQNITGATGISVATTTPGVTGVNSRAVGPGIGRNLRQFVIDLVDGTVHKRVLVNNGEAVWTGTKTYSGGGPAISQFTLQPFKDSNGVFYVILDDDPAMSETFA